MFNKEYDFTYFIKASQKYYIMVVFRSDDSSYLRLLWDQGNAAGDMVYIFNSFYSSSGKYDLFFLSFSFFLPANGHVQCVVIVFVAVMRMQSTVRKIALLQVVEMDFAITTRTLAPVMLTVLGCTAAPSRPKIVPTKCHNPMYSLAFHLVLTLLARSFPTTCCGHCLELIILHMG